MSHDSTDSLVTRTVAAFHAEREATEAALDAAMDPRADDEVDEPLAPAGFSIDSQARAEWLVNKHVGLDEEEARIEAQFAVLKRAIERKRAGLEAAFGDQLRAWVTERLEWQGGRRRTVDLLTGSCSFRRVPGGPRIVDAQQTLAWALVTLPSAVDIPVPKPRVVAERIKAHVEATGEIPPGVELVDERDAFTIKGARGAK